MTFCQWRHFYRIVDDECGLNVVAFTFFAKDFIDKFAFTHCFIGFDAELLAHVAKLHFVHACDVDASKFFDSINHCDTFIRSLEVDNVVAHFHLCGAINFKSDAFDHFFGEVHHPVVVLVRNIDFHTSKLWVVSAVHTLVAEVLREFIHPFETTHDEAFEIQLIGNAKIQRNVERIVVSDEWTSRCTTRD